MKKRTPQIIFLCSIVIFLQGCLISIATYGMIQYVRGDRHHTATVQLETMPDEVYASLVRRFEEQPDITIIQQDDSGRIVEATKGVLRVTAKVTDLGEGTSKLTITADAGDAEMTDEELALRVVKQICSDLTVDCETTYE